MIHAVMPTKYPSTFSKTFIIETLSMLVERTFPLGLGTFSVRVNTVFLVILF